MWLDGASDTGNSSEVSETIEGIATSKSASIRQASINYLGYSNVHQVPMYALLRQEADRARWVVKESTVNVGFLGSKRAYGDKKVIYL